MSFNLIKSFFRSIRNKYYKKINKSITNVIFGQAPFMLQKAGLLRELKPAFISTMTKSGTWYNREFFYFFDQLIRGKSQTEIFDNMISKKLKIPALIKSYYKETGYDAFFISHWSCPGFDSYNGQYKNDWDKLTYYSEYTYPSYLGQIPSNLSPKMLDGRFNTQFNWNPEINDKAKIIYFFRNPLDQSVSYFQGIQKMKLQSLRYRVDSKGNKILIKNISEFIRTVGMDMYIKHLFPFKIMKEKYPNNFLLIEYESLVKNPEQIFSKIFSFLNISLNTPEKMRCFSEALKLSSKENIMHLENAYGRSIGGQFMDKYTNERQLRDGKVGKWEHYLNNNDLLFVEEKLKVFGMSLNEFIIN